MLRKLLTADHVATLQEDDFCATLLRKWIVPTTYQRCSSSPSHTVALLWKTICHALERTPVPSAQRRMETLQHGCVHERNVHSLSVECLRRMRVQKFRSPLTTSEGTGYCIRRTSRTMLHSSVPQCMVSKNGEWAADAQALQTLMTLT
jgi:hypothetical protein